MSIRPDAREVGWEFLMPDGTPHQVWCGDDRLPFLLEQQQRHAKQGALGEVMSFGHPEARKIQPLGGGAGFDLHECVRALFSMRLHDSGQQAA